MIEDTDAIVFNGDVDVPTWLFDAPPEEFAKAVESLCAAKAAGIVRRACEEWEHRNKQTPLHPWPWEPEQCDT